MRLLSEALSEIYVEGSSLVKVQKSESKINKTVLCFLIFYCLCTIAYNLGVNKRVFYFVEQLSSDWTTNSRKCRN